MGLEMEIGCGAEHGVLDGGVRVNAWSGGGVLNILF